MDEEMKYLWKGLKVNFYASLLGLLLTILQFVFEYKGLPELQNWARISSHLSFYAGGLAVCMMMFWNLKNKAKEKIESIIDHFRRD